MGDGSAGTERKSLVDSNLTVSPPEIRNILTSALDNGLLADIEATSRYAALQADNQRQETRRVFNEVGTSLFAKLKFSPIVKVALRYRLYTETDLAKWRYYRFDWGWW